MTISELYQLHHKLVFNLALQYTQNIEDAEEITQDVFVTIHYSIDQFNRTAELRTWIYRITINKSLDFLKAKKRKKRFGFVVSLFENQPTSLAHSFNHPGIELEQKEAIKNIFEAINKLNGQQKTVIILSKIEKKSQKEIADIMSLSVKAVDSLISRAKNNLAKKLNNIEGI